MLHHDRSKTAVQMTLAAALAVTMMTMSACQERKYNRYLHARDTITLSAGDAVAHNKAVHTIDPWPAHARNQKLTTDGKRILLGMERYQKNESIEPEGMGTSDRFKDEGGPPPAPPPAPPAP